MEGGVQGVWEQCGKPKWGMVGMWKRWWCLGDGWQWWGFRGEYWEWGKWEVGNYCWNWYQRRAAQWEGNVMVRREWTMLSQQE